MRTTKSTTNVLCVLLFLGLCAFSAGCASGWSPSDDEAVELVKTYYLFFHGGKTVEATVTARREFVRECQCFPIEFQITPPARESFRKTFYFFKNDAGEVDIRETKFAMQK